MNKVRLFFFIFLAAALVFTMVPPISASALEIPETTSLESLKTDIPQVFITTGDEITKEDYVPAVISVVDSKGGSFPTITDSNAKVKLRGNSTSYLSKHPYNIKFDSPQSVLGMPEGKKWCMLANYMDTSLMRNRLAYSFAEEIGLPYSIKTRYVDVWLNGEFNGNYLLTVPVEAGSNRVDIDTARNEYLIERESRLEDDVTYLNTYVYRFALNEPETLTKEQESWLFNFLVAAESAMESGDSTRIKKYVDFNTFIDFYLVQELFKNLDHDVSSTRFYIKDNKLYAGPLWDCDLSAGNVSNIYDKYTLYNNHGTFGSGSGNSYEGFWAVQDPGNPKSWISMLMKCEEFSNAFYLRYMDLQSKIVNLYQDNGLGGSKMDLLLQEYGNSFARDVKRWPVDSGNRGSLYRSDEKTFESSVSFLRQFLKNRNVWLLDALSQYKPAAQTGQGSSGTLTAPQSSARVAVNGKDLAFEAYNIEGNNYFKLRDLAMAVSGTAKQFEVAWDSEKSAINLKSKLAYTPVGGEMRQGDGAAKPYSPGTSKIYKDGNEIKPTAYLINGNNYFKLRDVASVFDFGVTWNAADLTIMVDTNASYTE